MGDWASLYETATLTVFPFWLLMMIAVVSANKTLTRFTIRVIVAYTLLLSFFYLYLRIVSFRTHSYTFRQELENFGTLAGLRAMFQQDSLLLSGWVHYLAFDMLVGLAIVENAVKRSFIVRVATAGALVVTCMAGPVGWIVFLAVRILERTAAGKGSEVERDVKRRSGRLQKTE